MSTVNLLRRQDSKTHPTTVLEADQAVLGGLVRSTGGVGALYDDANTTSVTLGAGSAVTSVTIGVAGTTTTIAGDLVVAGTTTSVDSEVVNIADNHVFLNNGYTTTVAQSGGLVVNYLPTATSDTSTTGGFASATTVNTVGAATFTAGDFVLVSGAANAANDGIYEALTHAANVLTIDSTPVHSFAQTAFTTDTGDTSAVITNVTVSALQAGTDGAWEQGAGSTAAGLTFVDLGSGGGNNLQQAYDVAAPIVTDATGNFAVSGTQGATFDMDLASSFNVTGNSLTLSTTTSGVLDIDAAGALSLNAAGANPINLGDDANTGTISIGTAGIRTIAIGSAIATTVTVDADTGISLDAAGASNFTVDGADLTLATTTSSDVRIEPASGIISSDATSIQLDEGFTIQCGGAAGGIDFAVVGTGQLTTDATTFTAGAEFDVIATTGDQGLTSTTGSVVITGNEAVADAVQLTAGNAAGGVDINAGATSGTVTIDGGGACTITTAGINLAAGSSEIDLTTSGSIDLNATAGAISLDSATNSGFTVAASAATLTLAASGGSTNQVIINSAGTGFTAVDINATAGGIALDSILNSGFTVTGSGQVLQLRALGGGGNQVFLTSAGTGTGAVALNATAGGVTIDAAAGAISIDAGGASNFTVASAALTLSTTTSGDLTLSTSTAGDILLNGAAEIDLTSAGLIDINAGANLDIDSTGTITIDATTTVAITSGTSNAVTVDSGTTGTVNVGTGTGAKTVNVGTGGTGAKTVNIGDESVASSSVTLESGSTGDITFDSRAITTPVTFNDASDVNPDASFASGSVIGMLNELKIAGVAEADQVVGDFITTGLTVGHTVYMNATADTVADTDASALATAESFVGIVKTVGALGTGEIVMAGVFDPVFETGSTRPANGAAVYLSETAGVVTGTIPTGTPNSGVIQFRIGFMKDQSTLSATVGAGERGEIALAPAQFVEL